AEARLAFEDQNRTREFPAYRFFGDESTSSVPATLNVTLWRLQVQGAACRLSLPEIPSLPTAEIGPDPISVGLYVDWLTARKGGCVEFAQIVAQLSAQAVELRTKGPYELKLALIGASSPQTHEFGSPETGRYGFYRRVQPSNITLLLTFAEADTALRPLLDWSPKSDPDALGLSIQVTPDAGPWNELLHSGGFEQQTWWFFALQIVAALGVLYRLVVHGRAARGQPNMIVTLFGALLAQLVVGCVLPLQGYLPPASLGVHLAFLMVTLTAVTRVLARWAKTLRLLQPRRVPSLKLFHWNAWLTLASMLLGIFLIIVSLMMNDNTPRPRWEVRRAGLFTLLTAGLPLLGLQLLGSLYLTVRIIFHTERLTPSPSGQYALRRFTFFCGLLNFGLVLLVIALALAFAGQTHESISLYVGRVVLVKLGVLCLALVVLLDISLNGYQSTSESATALTASRPPSVTASIICFEDIQGRGHTRDFLPHRSLTGAWGKPSLFGSGMVRNLSLPSLPPPARKLKSAFRQPRIGHQRLRSTLDLSLRSGDEASHDLKDQRKSILSIKSDSFIG
ncbi:hypothetical protein H4R33_006956, partial [Dimargaris cristalligena]